MSESYTKAIIEGADERDSLPPGKFGHVLIMTTACARWLAESHDRLAEDRDRLREALVKARAFAVSAVTANVDLDDFDPTTHVVVKAIDDVLRLSEEVATLLDPPPDSLHQIPPYGS